MTATPQSLGLTQRQFFWATKIVGLVKNMNLQPTVGQRVADICLATALTESSLLMYANGNNSRSMQLPHDAVGWDHGSVGLYQQQVGGASNSTANWGTTDQCMDVNYSTHKFVHELFNRDWKNMTNWNAAQAVQGSFDPTGGNYRRNDPWAIRIRTALWSQAAPIPPKPVPNRGPVQPPVRRLVGTYRVQPGDTLASIAHKYTQPWVTWQSLAKLNNLSNPDHILIGQVLRIG